MAQENSTMTKGYHTSEQIIRWFTEGDRLINKG
jgi:hypothetical protein